VRIRSVEALKAPAPLALTAVLLAACGGGGDERAKVEASLRQYVSTVIPEESGFPLGAGAPQVRKNSCKSHPRMEPPPDRTSRVRGARIPEGLTFWSCVATFAKTPFDVAVAVKRSGEIYLASPVSQAPPPPRATVYEGGP